MEYATYQHPDAADKTVRTRWLKALSDACRQRLSEEGISYYLEAVSAFSDKSVISCVKYFIDQKVSRMPSGKELQYRCRESQSPKKENLIKSTTCYDYWRNQSETSRFLCEKNVNPENAEASLASCGHVVCGWHLACRQAIINPGGSSELMVKYVIEMWSGAIGDPVKTGKIYLDVLGFIPDDDDDLRAETKKIFNKARNTPKK